MAWKDWDKDGKVKDWDRSKPFHRINSPSFDAARTPPDGHGFECGCRSVDDFPMSATFTDFMLQVLRFFNSDGREIIHAVPGWVPVERGGPGEREIEGPLIRSFQTWTDFPAYQWHHWYDWNFYIEPQKGFEYIRGRGNRRPEVGKGEEEKKEPVSSANSMECEWDAGSIGLKPGPMFVRPQITRIESNGETWWWPTTGHYVWMAGRWIYDCGHSDPPDDKVKGVMRTELHPVKAMATARWGAFNFEENGGRFVPAIQFMFFASKFGGYKTWDTINDQDYEFIVDLPPIEGAAITWVIGRTPEAPFNTGVLRQPHLLIKLEHELFDAAIHTDNKDKATIVRNAVRPIIEPIVSEPGKPPRQVKIKFPLTSLPPSTSVYGMRIWLGWYDPDKSQAAKVKKVTVKLKEVRTGSVRHDRVDITQIPILKGIPQGIPIISGIGPMLKLIPLDSEWQLRIGVNGHWIQTPVISGVGANESITRGILGKEFVFFLSEDDAITVSTHGIEVDNVGSWFDENNKAARTAKVKGRELDWEVDVVNSPNKRKVLEDTCHALIDLLSATWGVQNDALGLIDPGHGPRKEAELNPFPIKGKAFKDKEFVLTAFPVTEVGKLAELMADKTQMDYELHYTVSIEDQELS